ncbi:MAG TPA: fibronectin type III domain-containing protein [Puia sp.]|nr:fibronectin type III domain-containing protein [Puia sp.]
MKAFTRIFGLLLITLVALSGPTVVAQSILNPNDSVITYNPASPPRIPAYGSIAKWVRTVRMSWNTNLWKCYIYNGNQFRLRFPKSYVPGVNDGKLYPMLIFMHGEGEGGTTYDNEYSLFHGGNLFDAAVSNGTFDGYILVMQTTGGWGPPQMTAQQVIIDYMIKNNKLDPFRVTLNGLSGGGSGDWQLYQSKQCYIAGLVPMSSVAIAFDSPDTVAKYKFTPIWNIHGGKDGSPAPYTAAQVLAAMQAQGANYVDLNMTTQGHDTWDSTWSMPAFWPWLLNQYGSNPWPLFGRTQFCKGDKINITVGLTPGYQAYQWRKNGVLLASTTNTITVTDTGTYDARVERNGNWSQWSPVPVHVYYTPPTVTPPITISGLMSKVIPAPDGNTGVTLAEPSTYVSWVWQKVGNNTTLGTSSTYYATSPGQYQAEVTEQYGCSTSFSAPFTVVNANGPNKPDPASGLALTTLSNTSQILTWTQNPYPVNNETNFEVYRGTHTGGPYTLVAITGPDASRDTVTGLTAGTQYYYIVRAVNGTGAAANSNEASGSTTGDTQPPTAPGNLTVTGSTQTSISLKWTASTDNVGVLNYWLFVNGQKSYVLPRTTTTFAVQGLTFQQSYSFYVQAVDAAGNVSPASGQVSAEAIIPGITYSFFKNAAGLTALPNYARQTATSTGISANISLSPATQTTNFGFLFNGFLHVTTAGTYNFQLTSSDGSKLYLGALNGTTSPYSSTGTATVSDDGVHSSPATATSANVTLSVGLYPIAIAYFEGASSPTPTLTVLWKTPGSSSFVPIPNPAFADALANNGNPPPAPTGLGATTQSYSTIALNWTDNSGGQASTEVWRSTNATTGFATIGTVAPGINTFTDATASPNTLYYYEVRADNQYGQSAFTSAASATTQPLPAIPTVPTGLTATATSAASISVSWTNTASNATSIQLYRSFGTDQQYVLWATLSPSANSFADNGLFPNSTYFYKVQAVNAGGNSGFAPEVSATTQDVRPVITKLPANEQAKYGTTTTFNVSATSQSSGALTFKASSNMPNFAVLTDNGNGTAALAVTPTIANVGNYPGLYIVVTDAFGGTDTTTFTLAVNNNTPPTINAISNVTMNEGDSLNIALSGSNVSNPSDVLSFAVANGPGGSIVRPVSNGSATLSLHPNFASAGTYTVQVTLNDITDGLSATTNFTLTVKNKSPFQTILTRMVYQDAGSLGLPWNGLNGSTTNNLVDSNGNVTTVGLSFSPNTWWNTFNGGSTTGNNSGVYPDVVLKDYNWFGSIYGAPNTITGTLSGMDTSQQYDLTFFANSVYSGMSDNGWTAYSAGGQTVQLHVQNNTQNTVTIQNLKPAADGTLVFTMGLGQNNTQLGYLNALVIHKHFDDGTAPAGISGLTAQNAAGKVTLNWTDSAYNATGYEVWRELTQGGTFALLGTVTGNAASTYVDSTVTSNTGYTYEVRAVNTHGQSPFDSVSTVTLARLPKINPIANIILKDTASLTVNVTTVDDPNAQLTLTAANLPPFATFTDNGNGTGVLTIAPSPGTVGVYPGVSITVTDALNNTASTSFSVAVTEPNVQSIYLSLSGGATSPAPWNSLTTPPFTGTVVSNLTDDSGTPTGISATLVDGWYWYGVTGTANGNQNGTQPSQLVYPPSVVQNFLYDPSNSTRRIQFSGLNNAKLYNFVFFNSQWDGTNGLTNFTVNGQTVSLQADWNINHTVQINGIAPVGGVITVTVQKAAAALNAYLCSIVLQAYDPGTLLSPADLRALTITQTTVNLQWQDRAVAETGYEVWRATDLSGGYSLLASLPAGTTTYFDKGLQKNTNYYYIVRTVNGASHSSYSTPLAVTTYQDAIYIHPSYTSAGRGPTPPWNNLNNSGGVGARWSNFIDSTGVVTSVGMQQTGAFAGSNQLGDVTGNNSGVYPDPVILQQYVLFPGNIGSFTISGLNLSKVYDFTFFGSENYEGGDQNTGYIVNGDTVYLNALYNQQAIVTLHGVTPDANGNAFMTMFCQGSAIAGWFNAVVIQGYTPVPRNNPNVPQSTGGQITPLQVGVSTAPVVPQALQMDTVVRAYPNPFHTSFTLSVPVTTKDEKVIVTLYDANGQVAYRKEFDNVQEGMNYLRVGGDAGIGGPGVYIGKVLFSSGRATQTIKLIKQ